MSEALSLIHPLAEVEPGVVLGKGSRIWRYAHVRASASIGEDCIIGKGVYVDTNVCIGSRVKIQNNASLFEGVTLEDGVFVGPHACFTNDFYPRAITPEGTLKSSADWEIRPTLVKYGASIGAQVVIVCGITIGRFALIGAGSVVTKSVPDHGLVLGNPAHLQGYVCRCARLFSSLSVQDGKRIGWCEICNRGYEIGDAS
jgi:acetyltransferase-like isoleucine patch superfamily enzyme